MKRWGTGLVAALSLAASGVHAEELNVAFEAAVRAGFAVPFGKSGGSSDLSDFTRWEVPLQLDAGVRVGSVFVGGFFSYAFAKSGGGFDNTCNQNGNSCSTHQLRAGIDGAYHFLPSTAVDPWVGLGVGYEWLTLSESNAGGSASLTIRGFEFGSAQFGIDFALGSHVKLGPYAQFSLGEYTTGSLSGSTTSFSSDITDKTIHFWLGGGVRLAFVL